MTSFSEHQSTRLVKMLLIGDSGTGKTGSLASLVSAGYKLRIIDLDNGLDALHGHVMAECPDKIENVSFETLTDNASFTKMGQIVLKALPRAFIQTCKAVDVWPDDQTKPAEWGSSHILVIDSLTALSRYAFNWAKANKPALKVDMHWIGAAQSCIMDFLYALTSVDFATNVIVISHIDYREDERGTQGYVSSIGKAIGPKIPHRFNTLIAARRIGQGKNVKRTLQTLPTAMLDLKNPIPAKLGTEPLPLESGLADLFSKLTGD